MNAAEGLLGMLGAGHSLGGALATLAAYDVAKALEAAGLRAHLACYTFGAPRTGNHAFALDYRETVPDTWGIINDQVGQDGCWVPFTMSRLLSSASRQ